MAKNKMNPKSLENLELGKFEPGKSGNPKGREPGSRNTKTVIKEILDTMAEAEGEGDKEKILALSEALGRKLTRRELMIFRQIQKAITGDTTAFNAICDREDGKPKQEMGFGPEHGNIQITFNEEKPDKK